MCKFVFKVVNVSCVEASSWFRNALLYHIESKRGAEGAAGPIVYLVLGVKVCLDGVEDTQSSVVPTGRGSCSKEERFGGKEAKPTFPNLYSPSRLKLTGTTRVLH